MLIMIILKAYFNGNDFHFKRMESSVYMNAFCSLHPHIDILCVCPLLKRVHFSFCHMDNCAGIHSLVKYGKIGGKSCPTHNYLVFIGAKAKLVQMYKRCFYSLYYGFSH